MAGIYKTAILANFVGLLISSAALADAAPPSLDDGKIIEFYKSTLGPMAIYSHFHPRVMDSGWPSPTIAKAKLRGNIPRRPQLPFVSVAAWSR